MTELLVTGPKLLSSLSESKAGRHWTGLLSLQNWIPWRMCGALHCMMKMLTLKGRQQLSSVSKTAKRVKKSSSQPQTHQRSVVKTFCYKEIAQSVPPIWNSSWLTGEYAAKLSQLTDFQEAKQTTPNLSVVNYQSSMHHVDVTATTVVVSSSTPSC